MQCKEDIWIAHTCCWRDHCHLGSHCQPAALCSHLRQTLGILFSTWHLLRSLLSLDTKRTCRMKARTARWSISLALYSSKTYLSIVNRKNYFFYFFWKNWYFIVKVISPAKSRGLIGWCFWSNSLPVLIVVYIPLVFFIVSNAHFDRISVLTDIIVIFSNAQMSLVETTFFYWIK